MSQSLATKYRPKDFDDVVGQSSIVKILKRQIDLADIKNCYLFCGPSGTGKTTLGRILANRINKGIGVPIEVDAASNSGVDNVRDIIKDAQERSIEGNYKVYIFDEAHAFSNAAWQAFLKCIEEPPMYTIFIFCTTDPQKIPQTIINRVMRFNLTRLSVNDIKNRLKYVCEQEGFVNYKESIDYISKIADGGMRDALAFLDKCVSYSSDLSINNVLEALGNYSYNVFFKLANDLLDGNEAEVLKVISDYYDQGNDLKLFVDQYLSFNIDLAKYSLFKSCDLIRIPSSMENQLKNVTNFDNPQKYYTYVMDRLLELKNMIKNDTNIRSSVEVVFLRITRCA